MNNTFRFLSSVRRDVPWSRVNTTALFGGLSAALLSKLLGASNTSAMGWGLAGFAGAGYGSMLYNNARDWSGGHFLNNPDYYDIDNLRQRIDARGNRRVVFYVPGTRESLPDEKLAADMADRGIFIFPHADGDRLTDIINGLGSDYTIDLIGHSTGGAAIGDILPNLKHQLNSIHLLDPTYSDPLRRFSRRISGMPAHRQNNVHVYMPTEGNEGYVPDWFPWALTPAMKSYLAVGSEIPGSTVTRIGNSHSMLDTDLRLPRHQGLQLGWADNLMQTIDSWNNRHRQVQ